MSFRFIVSPLFSAVRPSLVAATPACHNARACPAGPWCLLLCNLLLAIVTTASGSSPVQTSQPAAHFALVPLYFEANHGQADVSIDFLGRSAGATLFFSPTETTIRLSTLTDSRGQHRRDEHTANVHLRFIGANAGAQIEGIGRLAGKVNYLIGDDPLWWRPEVPAYARLSVDELYPGIDLVYYGNPQQLEYDFILSPGADAKRIAFCIEGVDEVRTDAQGDLVFKIATREIRQHKPIIYQLIDGLRKEVAGGYRVTGNGKVQFDVADYDRRHALVIDPILSFSTFLGGSGSDIGWDINLGPDGSIYVAGETLSADLGATSGAFKTNYSGGFAQVGGDAFVARFDSTGSNLIYLTYLGGTGNDAALALAIDPDGNAYVTGVTDSTNFPTFLAISNRISGTATNFGLFPFDAFVTKLNPTGSQLLYSTYLGGNDQDQGLDIAVDANLNVYVTGFTESTNFPIASPLSGQHTNHGRKDAFITKIVASGTAFGWSTYLGETNFDQGNGIAVNAAGTVFVTGTTSSTNFPVFIGPTNTASTNVFQSFLRGGADAFLTQIDASGTTALSTFFGGLGNDTAFKLVLDASGNIHLTGSQGAFGFPVIPGALNPGGIFKSVDAGGSWSAANGGLYYNVFEALAQDPVTPSTLYAGSWRGLVRTTDGAASWQTIYDPGGQVRALVIDPSNSSILYAGIDTSIHRINLAGTISSTNLTVSINALAIDPVSPNILYAGTQSGVFRSTNSGASWTKTSSGIGNASVHDLVFHPSASTTLYAATASGVYRTLNSGTQWQAMNNGLTNTLVRVLAIDPAVPATLYAGTSLRLFRTTNAGTNWSVTGLGPSNITALAFDPGTSATIYAGTINGLFRSTDMAATWTLINTGLLTSNITTLAIHLSSPNTLYAATRGFDAFGGTDGFYARFNSAGSNVSSVVFGGIGTDEAWDVGIDAAGNAFMIGATISGNFPTSNIPAFLRATNSGSTEAFALAINSDSSAFLYSTFLGGSRIDTGRGIDVDAMGNAYLVGQTASTNFPATNGYDLTFAGVNDAFIARISLDAPPPLTVSQQGSAVRIAWPAGGSQFVLESTAALISPVWSPVSPAPTASNGWWSVTVPCTNHAFFRLRR